MDFLKIVTAGLKVVEQGKSIKGSSALSNAEATTALVYGILSALVTIVQLFGVDPKIGDTELHTIANGWTATAGLIYGLYRIVTNPAAGVKAK